MAHDLNCLSYWFPRIEAAGLPVPATTIIILSETEADALSSLLDGPEAAAEDAIAAFRRLENEITRAAESMGLPCHLRTGHTSGKHEWNRTCHVEHLDDIARHITALTEYSAMASLMGLPVNIWAVREYLPVRPLGRCPRYHEMPICREFRAFVEDGTVRCLHPYWPREALERGHALFEGGYGYDTLCQLDTADETEIRQLAAAAGRTLGGPWSIDFIDTARGWVLIDMAEAQKSFHWQGCPRAPFRRPAAAPE